MLILALASCDDSIKCEGKLYIKNATPYTLCVDYVYAEEEHFFKTLAPKDSLEYTSRFFFEKTSKYRVFKDLFKGDSEMYNIDLYKFVDKELVLIWKLSLSSDPNDRKFFFDQKHWRDNNVSNDEAKDSYSSIYTWTFDILPDTFPEYDFK